MACHARAVRRAIWASVLVASLVRPPLAVAGAWTQPEGETQIIADVGYSIAGQSFDHHSRPNWPVQFDKILTTVDGEYGWNDWLTLVLAPEYAHARLLRPGKLPEQADDGAVMAGARVRLWNGGGVFSAQMTAKTAGAFDMTVSADGAPGRQLELRLLYGANFTLFGRDGFWDAEIAQRWIEGLRADEMPIDLTLGLRVSKRMRVLVQSFNIVAQGNARQPYSYYRAHKLSLSLVTDLSPGLSFESGAYISPAGQNALDEQGFDISLWVHF